MSHRWNWRSRLALMLGAGAAVVAVAAVAGYLYLRPGDSPAPLTLTTKPLPSSASSGTFSPATASGAWTVGSGSVAGYRVREQLADLPSQSDAVGRTPSVTGTMTLSPAGAGAATVSGANFSVDVSSLKSDRTMRDNRIHNIGLQSSKFPTATFQATDPIAVPASAADGRPVHLSATGDLTIHGVTKRETIPLDAHLAGSQIEVVGTLTFPFEDFGMQPPSIGGFVSVQDHATLEFDLFLRHG